MPHTIQHDDQRGRFETTIEGMQCVADYRLVDGVMRMTHTYVPHPLEGRGIAAELVAAALDHARVSGFKVDPICSYVRVYMSRHPETKTLLA